MQKRTELISRAAKPKMWEYTDKLNAKKKAPETVLKKRNVFRKIASTINVALGIFLFIPGLMEPEELTILLVVGGFAIILGLVGLLGGSFFRKNIFIKPAKKLLKTQNIIYSEEYQIIFSENYMELHSGCKESVSVAYSEFEYIIEEEDIFLVTYQGNATVLKKEDLQNNTPKDFSAFLSAKSFYIPLSAK